mmetsp:Transcript_13053/g.11541  ORF Transcript_13053/g.11541 Transcript_13053/m.11541 type:complete len:99 (+) Transcript_13053:442-738(+)
MIAPYSVVPPGRLIPADQAWGGNPCEFIKDLNVGERVANYSKSYIHSTVGDANKETFLGWANNYLDYESTHDDLHIEAGFHFTGVEKHWNEGHVKYYT